MITIIKNLYSLKKLIISSNSILFVISYYHINMVF